MNFSLIAKSVAITAMFYLSASGGTIYNPSTDWAGTNPSGVWSYLDRPQGGVEFTQLAYYNTGANIGSGAFAGTLMDFWWNGASMPYSRGVAHNMSSVPQTGWTITVPPGMLSLDSEWGATSVRFTAPATSSYRVSGYFQHTDVVGYPVQVGILWNGAVNLMNQGPLVGPSQQMQFYFAPLSLNAGDTLDFTVSSIDTFAFLSTGLMLEIEQVPEPAAWQMGAMGLGLIAGARYASHRAFRRCRAGK